MKRLTLSPKLTLIAISFFLLNSFTVLSQVGIGNTNPNADSLLEVGDGTDTQGVLLPRVALTNTTSPAPLSTDVAGMIVYNTATAGDVTPGIYYNDGAIWVRVNPAASDDWKTTGNAGTTAGTNFIGTTDGQDFVISTNNTEEMRVLNGGQVAINTATPVAGHRFTVEGDNAEYAINGYTTSGTGVYGENTTGVGNGIYGLSSNVGVRGYGAHGAILESGLDTGYGLISWNTATSGSQRTGLIALGQNLGLITFDGTGIITTGTNYGGVAFADNGNGTGIGGVGNGGTTSFSPVNGSGVSGTGDTGIYGKSTTTASGTGVVGVGNDLNTYYTSGLGEGVAGTGYQLGVFGYATVSGIDLPNNTIGSAGGYFANGDGGFAYVGAWADPNAGNDQNFKIIGTGSVSTIVKDTNNNPVTMFAIEAPEVQFQDIGVGKLDNGKAKILLDPNFSKNIQVDKNHPIKVFIQLEGDCNGVFVTNKSELGFEVRELNNGNSSVPFSWTVYATRANEEFTRADGTKRTSNNSMRFPPAPKQLVIKNEMKVEQGTKVDLNNQVINKLKEDIVNKSSSN